MPDHIADTRKVDLSKLPERFRRVNVALLEAQERGTHALAKGEDFQDLFGYAAEQQEGREKAEADLVEYERITLINQHAQAVCIDDLGDQRRKAEARVKELEATVELLHDSRPVPHSNGPSGIVDELEGYVSLPGYLDGSYLHHAYALRVHIEGMIADHNHDSALLALLCDCARVLWEAAQRPRIFQYEEEVAKLTGRVKELEGTRDSLRTRLDALEAAIDDDEWADRAVDACDGDMPIGGIDAYRTALRAILQKEVK